MIKALVGINCKLLALALFTSVASAQTLEHSQDPALTKAATIETEVPTLKVEAPRITPPTHSAAPDDDISAASWPFNNEASEAQVPRELPSSRKVTTASDALPEVKVIEREATPAYSIKDFELMVEGMLSKKKITGALVGTTISAALSAHPVGAFLGGLVGAMVGKESKYKPANKASPLTEQDLFAALDKLAEDQAATDAAQPETPAAMTSEVKPPVTEISSLSVTPIEPQAPSSNDCYKSNNAGPRDRTAMKHCFYYAY